MKTLRIVSLIVTLVLAALGFTASTQAAFDMPQIGDQIEAVNGQRIVLPGDLVSDWSYAGYFRTPERARPILDAFFNVEARLDSRFEIYPGGRIPTQTLFYSNIGSGKFRDARTGEEINPWGDSRGRVVAITRTGTNAVFLIYADVLSPSRGRALKTDRLINPAQDLCGWGRGGC